MKYVSTAWFVSLFLLTAGPAFAAMSLVVVALPTQAEVARWCQLKPKACEYLEGHAFLLSDGDESSVLSGLGFQARVVDKPIDSHSKYYVVYRLSQSALLPSDTVWEGSRSAIVRLSPDQARLMKSQGLKLRPMSTRILPVRFWRNLTGTVVSRRSLSYDPYVQSLVDQVSPDSMLATIVRLQDFQTRFVLTDSSYAASAWVKQKFEAMGYAAEFDSFSMDGSWAGDGTERSVIARLPGSGDPGAELVICGHHDSYCEVDPVLFAPGADDNASGVAATIEAARIFRGQAWRPTIAFASWGGEEEWMWGSGHYAFASDSLGRAIDAVVNMDMIGYMNDAAYDCGAGYSDSYGFCQWLLDLYFQSAQTYVPGLTTYSIQDFISDNTYFSQVGYPAIGTIEWPDAWVGGNPNYHQPTDLWTTLDPALLAMIAKASLATVAVIAVSPGMVQDVAAYDMGSGSAALVEWTPNPEPGIVTNKILYGRESGSYTDSVSTAGSCDTIVGLLQDSTYYFTVWAFDTAGRQSPAAFEVSVVPRSVPDKPIGLSAVPVPTGIGLHWRHNLELDMSGYRLYRSQDGGGYDSLNTALLTDTSYADSPLSGAHRYYYKVRAFDVSGNASPLSDSAYGRPATLDQGVLVVDETKDWITNPWPRDTAQDQFYDSILVGYQYEQYDFDSAALRPALSDLAPYSTVLWHADDYTQPLASGSIADLERYLNYGGNLWYVGWKPATMLADTGFLRGYLKVDSVSLSGATDTFMMASGELGYLSIAVDPAKVPIPSWGGAMRYIEAYDAADSSDVIYTIDMLNNASTFEGLPCGVRHLGTGFKTILFGFPLYYMDRDQAKLAAQQVMADFGETGVAAEPVAELRVFGFELYQNAPNPFRNSTVISYQLPKAGRVSLRIYNVAGQLVRTLVDGTQPAGRQSATWHSDADHGEQLASGIYFIQLRAGNLDRMSKALLLQ